MLVSEIINPLKHFLTAPEKFYNAISGNIKTVILILKLPSKLFTRLPFRGISGTLEIKHEFYIKSLHHYHHC